MATTLYLSARELARNMIAPVGDAHHLQDLIYTVLAARLAAEKQRKLYVFTGSQGGHEIKLLEDEAYVLTAKLD